MRRRFQASFALLLACAAAPSLPQLPPRSAAQPAPPQPASAELGYADTVDLVLASPVIADATIRSASRLKGPDAAGAGPGQLRFYVEADVGSLVRGTGGLAPRVGYVVDVAPDWRGRPPKLKKQRVLLFARRAAEPGSGQLQLAAPDGQRAWTPALDAAVRQIAQEVVAPDAPPRITGFGNAFHVPGSLPGEGETQLFLTTGNGRPVSLSVLRRPGERPRWAVALSEIVDEAAAPPRPGTLLWYRLACGLPSALPDRSIAELSPEDAAAAQEDYRFVRQSLGPCGRTRAGVSGGAGPA